jgi:uncharacterized protein
MDGRRIRRQCLPYPRGDHCLAHLIAILAAFMGGAVPACIIPGFAFAEIVLLSRPAATLIGGECTLLAPFLSIYLPRSHKLFLMYKQILVLLAITCLTAQAADTAPSDASIRELLEVTNVHKLVDQMIPQIDEMMQKAMSEALKGLSIPPEAQKMIDQSRADANAAMKEQLTWSKLEPLYLRIYKKSFNQGEVTGMVALYKTPAGQAMINKMPLVMQNTMAEMQTMMAPVMQRIQQSQQQLVAQIKKQAESKG